MENVNENKIGQESENEKEEYAESSEFTISDIEDAEEVQSIEVDEFGVQMTDYTPQLGNHLIDNPSNRLLCLLLLDSSGSMKGEPIEALNRGVQQFIEELQSDDLTSVSVELGIISFGNIVDYIQPVDAISQLSVPKLKADSVTPMGEAVELALNEMMDRITEYKTLGIPFYKPWLIIMTDGEPTDDYRKSAQRLKTLAELEKVIVFAIGVGANPNMEILGEFCDSKRPPKRLEGLRFSELFTWIKDSLSNIAASFVDDKIKLPAPGKWMKN